MSIGGRYGTSRGRREWLSALAVAAAPIIAMTLAAPARGLAASGPIRLLTFGDSLTAGYGLPHDEGFEAVLGAAVRAQGRDVVIVDGGVSGDTSAGGRARLDWVLGDPAGAPQAAIVELGGNDGLRGIDPRDTEANLTAILDAFAARHIPVLFCGILAPPNLGSAYGDQFRAVFERLGQRPGLLFDPFFLAGVAPDPALEQADHIHPNAEGVRRIVARLLPLVDRLLDEVKGAGP